MFSFSTFFYVQIKNAHKKWWMETHLQTHLLKWWTNTQQNWNKKELSSIFENGGWLFHKRVEYNQQCYLICDRESFCFTASYMEIHPSAVGEKPVCADLGLLFSFGLIQKENSWQLHSGYWRPSQWTACMMLSEKLRLVDKAWCL